MAGLSPASYADCLIPGKTTTLKRVVVTPSCVHQYKTARQQGHASWSAKCTVEKKMAVEEKAGRGKILKATKNVERANKLEELNGISGGGWTTKIFPNRTEHGEVVYYCRSLYGGKQFTFKKARILASERAAKRQKNLEGNPIATAFAAQQLNNVDDDDFV